MKEKPISDELKQFLANSRKLERMERDIAYMEVKLERMKKQKTELENAILSYMLKRRNLKAVHNQDAKVEIQRMGKEAEGVYKAK